MVKSKRHLLSPNSNRIVKIIALLKLFRHKKVHQEEKILLKFSKMMKEIIAALSTLNNLLNAVEFHSQLTETSEKHSKEECKSHTKNDQNNSINPFRQK